LTCVKCTEKIFDSCQKYKTTASPPVSGSLYLVGVEAFLRVSACEKRTIDFIVFFNRGVYYGKKIFFLGQIVFVWALQSQS
jgi:hypothetical protein